MDNTVKDPRSAAEFVQAALMNAANAQQQKLTSEILRIWGGVVATADLRTFLQEWDTAGAKLEYGMVEEVGRFYVILLTQFTDVLPVELFHLERARLFGAKGDLDLRRDGEQFRWRFIGDATLATPDLGKWGEDFWSSHSDTYFYTVEKSYKQWLPGDLRINDDWYDGLGLTEKSELRQVHYLDNGRIAFVRNVEFEEVLS